MAAFSSLTDRLSNAFKHLKSKGKLSEADIDGTIREIRRALLDADVALDVVRSFTGRIRERALGTEVSEALNPAQQVVKIVNEELTAVLGAGVPVYAPGKGVQADGGEAVVSPGQTTGDPVKVARDAVALAKQKLYDTVIIDTAGRLGVDEELMKQARDIRDAV